MTDTKLYDVAMVIFQWFIFMSFSEKCIAKSVSYNVLNSQYFSIVLIAYIMFIKFT